MKNVIDVALEILKRDIGFNESDINLLVGKVVKITFLSGTKCFCLSSITDVVVEDTNMTEHDDFEPLIFLGLASNNPTTPDQIFNSPGRDNGDTEWVYDIGNNGNYREIKCQIL